MFGGTTKINVIPNAIDRGVHNLHSHFEVQTFEVTKDDVTHGTQKHFSPPQQTLVLGYGNEEEVYAPFVGSNTPLHELRLVNCLVCKAKPTKEWKIKNKNWM
jgi:hypothetical protein